MRTCFALLLTTLILLSCNEDNLLEPPKSIDETHFEDFTGSNSRSQSPDPFWDSVGIYHNLGLDVIYDYYSLYGHPTDRNDYVDTVVQYLNLYYGTDISPSYSISDLFIDSLKDELLTVSTIKTRINNKIVEIEDSVSSQEYAIWERISNLTSITVESAFADSLKEISDDNAAINYNGNEGIRITMALTVLNSSFEYWYDPSNPYEVNSSVAYGPIPASWIDYYASEYAGFTKCLDYCSYEKYFAIWWSCNKYMTCEDLDYISAYGAAASAVYQFSPF